MGLCRTVSEINGDFSRKSQNFPTLRVFCAPLKGFPWNWVPALGVKKLNDGIPGRERSLTISSAVWIQSTNVADGQTNTGRQQRPRLRIGLRGKKTREDQRLLKKKAKNQKTSREQFYGTRTG